jgi:hypothetical protein
MTWYITVTGFFVAGVIAGGSDLTGTQTGIVLGVNLVLAVLFLWAIFHFAARIRQLSIYLENPSAAPEDWRRQHKNGRLDVIHDIKSPGNLFFVSIVVLMQIALWLLLSS